MKRIVIGFALISLASCAQKEVVVEGEKALSTGVELYNKKDYKRAKEELKKAIFKSEGLTPKQIMDARFALADSYYNREEYIDAIAEFEEFILLYPTSDKIPEALYKLSLSYMLISPDYKRDLTYVKKAEEKAQEILDNYPNSKFSAGAREIIKKANSIKAKHTIYIAQTYEKYGKPYPASVYYSEAYEKFKDYIQQDYIAYKLAYNLSKVELQYYHEIESYKSKIKDIEKEIDKEKDTEKKNILINRKKLLQEQLDVLLDRIKSSKEKAKEIVELFPKAFPDSPYASKIKELEKESKVENFLKRFNIFE